MPTNRLPEELHKAHTSGSVPNLRVWCTGLHKIDPARDRNQQEVMMTAPLRYPPAVLRELAQALTSLPKVLAYGTSGLPAPVDGPAPIRLYHSGHGHAGRGSWDCEVCGKEVAAMLQTLGVGAGDGNSFAWRDVLVVCGRRPFTEPESHNTVTSESLGFTGGLLSAGVPVDVLWPIDWKRDKLEAEEVIQHLAVPKMEKVTVTYYILSQNSSLVKHYSLMKGLERPVVVWLEGLDEGEKKPGRGSLLSCAAAGSLSSLQRQQSKLINIISVIVSSTPSAYVSLL